MAHNHVRIIRSRKSNARMAIGWLGLVLAILRPFARQEKEIRLSYMQELKAQESQKRMEVLEARKQKTSNDVVLGDLKIEEQKMRLILLERELEIRGLKTPPDNGERF